MKFTWTTQQNFILVILTCSKDFSPSIFTPIFFSNVVFYVVILSFFRARNSAKHLRNSPPSLPMDDGIMFAFI